MRAAVAALVVFAGALASSHAARAADSAVAHAIVPARSHASFTVTHLLVQHVSGNVPVVAGRVVFASETATVPTSVEATLDPRRISTGNRDRDDDLQGPDWFDTAHFATWTFATTAIVPTATGFTMMGQLTVHGVARPVTLEVVAVHAAPHAHYRATGTLDRHGFGMHVTPFDPAIGGELALELDVELE